MRPEAAAGTDLSGKPASGALDFLLRRMRHNSDFPALSDSVARIQRVANSENGNLDSLSAEILKDVALTGKLLRLVNTVRFKGAGGSIGTVSRAVALVGFNGIRNLAMSLVLLEHMHDKAHANQLQEEFLRSLLAGMLASELGTMVRDSEQAFIGAMFQNLGRQLTEFYFPQEARQVRGIVAAGARAPARPVSEDAAAFSVLGLSYEALGLGVAKVWGLPPSLQSCMLKPAGEPPARELHDADERVRWLAHAANQAADVLLQSQPQDAGPRIAALARRYARALGVEPARFQAAADSARQRLTDMVQSMHMQVGANSPAHRLLAPAAGAEALAAAGEAQDLLATHTLQATLQLTRPDGADAPADAAAVLVAGIQDITQLDGRGLQAQRRAAHGAGDDVPRARLPPHRLLPARRAQQHHDRTLRPGRRCRGDGGALQDRVGPQQRPVRRGVHARAPTCWWPMPHSRASAPACRPGTARASTRRPSCCCRCRCRASHWR